ncbi:MAG: ribosome assembly RNA-binding protein YhbY [Lachnospiraceae bacterium]|nr:ribosome assembly RNA-binding protein YhbY [Lachnospiraceae bacterium]
MTSKQRAYLKSLAMKLDPVFLVGKDSLTDGIVEAIGEHLEANELIKIGVLKNCADDPRAIVEAVAEATGAEVVQTIGKKMVLYKPAKDPKDRKIVLPK